jgi:hypothetical protein
LNWCDDITKVRFLSEENHYNLQLIFYQLVTQPTPIKTHVSSYRRKTAVLGGQRGFLAPTPQKMQNVYGDMIFNMLH